MHYFLINPIMLKPFLVIITTFSKSVLLICLCIHVFIHVSMDVYTSVDIDTCQKPYKDNPKPQTHNPTKGKRQQFFEVLI